MLRASSEHAGEEYDLGGMIGEGDGGIPHGGVLIEFAEALITGDDKRRSAARRALLDTLGPEALVDAAGVAATFNAVDRMADSTGTPIDDDWVEPTADLRDRLGIDDFPSAFHTES